MHSISMDLSKFEQYALPQSSGQFVMPNDKTVVSVDKNGNPVSYFWQDKWDYNAFFNLTKEIKSKYQINFHSDKHNPQLLLELKQRVYFLIWGAQGELLSMAGDTFRKFSQCQLIQKQVNNPLRVFKGTAIHSFSLLSNELVFNQLLHDSKALSEESLRNILKSLSVLTQVNKHFPEQSHFSLGIPEGKLFNQIAKLYSSTGKGHYPTIIPVIYEHLMGRLMKDVTAAHKKLADLRDVKSYAKKYGQTERQAVDEFKMIEGACFMSLSAFTGMRISELTQINATSYKEVELDGLKLCTLRSWTRKLEKLPREDAWACAPICKEALEVLIVLNDEYRSNKGDIHCSPRFRFDENRGSGNNINSQLKDADLNTTNLGQLFTRFSKSLDITYAPDEMDEIYRLLNPVVPARSNPIKAREDGTFYWHFSTHSLRRTFAHFVVGNGLVTLAALKHQFKHINLSMTAIYASHADVLTLLGIENPASVKKAIEDAEMENHIIYLKDIVDNPDEQSGGYIKSFDGDPRVMPEAKFNELIKQTKGSNKSTGYGTCFAGEKCGMGHLFEPSTCVGRECESLNINQAEATRWQDRHQRIGMKMQQMKELGFYNQNTLARELSDIRAAEKVMRDHSIGFERFELGAL
ncbi:site-specific integrase [Shewanella sp. SR43-4]|uniref:site-specific integrase n=1 Tax=Shewanella sp. SR43-4 TaxID=2760942 RepID=UPI0015F93A50|nr:site-specific integrase [Shewanella sp. SR43-4]MBB1319161.1 site-specific integrase [Shewanella sp. SR43-4]